MRRNSSIKFKGSGLYHFKIQPVNANVSFCKLEAEFLLYVDGTPFAHPIDEIAQTFTAFLFGFILLGLFVYHSYKSDCTVESNSPEFIDNEFSET